MERSQGEGKNLDRPRPAPKPQAKRQKANKGTAGSYKKTEKPQLALSNCNQTSRSPKRDFIPDSPEDLFCSMLHPLKNPRILLLPDFPVGEDDDRVEVASQSLRNLFSDKQPPILSAAEARAGHWEGSSSPGSNMAPHLRAETAMNKKVSAGFRLLQAELTGTGVWPSAPL